MFEHKSGVFLIAGLFFFALAFVSNALVPALMYQNLGEKSIPQLINPNLRYQFEDLANRYPEQFTKAFGEAPASESEKEQWWDDQLAAALKEGHKSYVGEACWHCHSQFVRPVANEDKRFGPVAQSWEYQNVLQRPVMFGTRRVGPDLSRESGRRSNDWQATHLFNPNSIVPTSVMPHYPWYFEGSPDKPSRRGLALITYIQWLGSWLDSYPYYERYQPGPFSPPRGDVVVPAPEPPK